LDISGNLTIVGPGADLLTIDGNSNAPVDNVFDLFINVTVNLSGMTITDGGYSADYSIQNHGNLTVAQFNISRKLSASAIRNDSQMVVESFPLKFM